MPKNTLRPKAAIRQEINRQKDKTAKMPVGREPGHDVSQVIRNKMIAGARAQWFVNMKRAADKNPFRKALEN